MPNIIYTSPSKYVQGKGALKELGKYVDAVGKKPLIISDEVVWEITKETVEKKSKRCEYRFSLCFI